MQETITQAIRPLFLHVQAAAEAVIRDPSDDGAWRAAQAANAHVRHLAKRAHADARAAPVEPINAEWLGTAHLVVHVPAHRHRVLASVTLLVCRHMDRLRMRDRADERAHATALAFALML